MEHIQRTAESAPAFRSPQAAAARYRKWRNGLLTKLRRAAARDGLKLGESTEDLAALERWSFHVYEENRFVAVGLAPGELSDALQLHVYRIAVRDFGAEWVATETWVIPGRFQFGVRQGLGTIMVAQTDPDDTRFWTGRGRRREQRLKDILDRYREQYDRLHFDRVMPHRSRLSRLTERRATEERMLLHCLNPWKERDLLHAFISNDIPGVYRQALEPFLADSTLCGPATRRGLHRFLKTAEPQWRATAIRILARLGDPAAVDLCLAGLRDPLPPEVVVGELVDILASAPSARASSRVQAVIEQLTRRKRRDPCPALFSALAVYLSATGPKAVPVRELLALLGERWDKLHEEEQVAFGDILPIRQPPKSNKRQSPQRVTISGKLHGNVFRRSIYRVEHPVRAISFID